MPVIVGGMAIHPGDIIVRDEDGLLAFASADVDALIEGARGQQAKQEGVRGPCQRQLQPCMGRSPPGPDDEQLTVGYMAQYLNAASFLELARAAQLRAVGPCSCIRTPLDGWQSQPLSLDESQFEEIGTLLQDDDPEPTYSEYLPGKTTYWAADAPIAPRYFPYNRCGVWECSTCGRLYLRYVEGGGYFVDRRIRAVRAALIEDVPLPA